MPDSCKTIYTNYIFKLQINLEVAAVLGTVGSVLGNSMNSVIYGNMALNLIL